MSEATQTIVDPSTLDGYTGKRISLTFNREVPGEGDAAPTTETLTQEGRVEMGAPMGLMFKEKGKSNVQLIEADSILDVVELAARDPKVSIKTLQPIAEGRVRQHLADRHGYTVEQANAFTEATAQGVHDAIDHSGLAHKHEVPQAQTEAGETPPESESDDSED